MRKDCKRWTTAEDAYIYDHYQRFTDAFIANHLGRTITAVKFRRESLDLTKNKVRKDKGVARIEEVEVHVVDYENMHHIDNIAFKGHRCGMSYGQYTGASKAERDRAMKERKEQGKDSRVNPWAVAVRI